METAGKLVCITVTKAKCFSFDRTPWCKNTNSLHMSNAQRCFKLRHTKVQALERESRESLESAGGDDHQFLLLTQDCFLTQHVLEPTRVGNVLDLILSSQN